MADFDPWAALEKAGTPAKVANRLKLETGEPAEDPNFSQLAILAAPPTSTEQIVEQVLATFPGAEYLGAHPTGWMPPLRKGRGGGIS
jgi:hypothetical protein